MTDLRIGSLFSGYGGLDLGVMLALGGRVLWHAEIDPAPARILAARFPDVPNLGDVTAVDWDTVPRVDVLTGGFPCQDVSPAGLRLGLRPGTRSGLWSSFAYAIGRLRPRLVVIENVRGLLSAPAHSDVEPCPGCVGDGSTEPALRALGAVLGDLAGLGFDAEWRGVTAASIGAPHERWREFIVAADASRDPRRVLDGDPRAAARDADDEPETTVRGLRDRAGTEPRRAGAAAGDTEDVGHERGRQARDGRSGPAHAGVGADPYPAGIGRGTTRWDDGVRAAGLVEGTAADAIDGGRDGRAPQPVGGPVGGAAATGSGGVDWGAYGPAIARWTSVLGRPAPLPWELGRTGGKRLAPPFVEWMLGLPAGWVTDVEGITRNDQLKALGNGVVPQQAAAAVTECLQALAVSDVA